MAQTFYEGNLQSTRRQWAAYDKFSAPLVQTVLFEILKDLSEGNGSLSRDDAGEVWVHGSGCWIRINPDGTVEIGEPAA
jgi:hypothetical protein